MENLTFPLCISETFLYIVCSPLYTDVYIPFENSPDFMFPYKQLMTVYEGNLKEDETWLSECSALIRADKNCIRKILHDREPKDCRYIAMNDERLKYVRELSKKTR